MPLLLSLSPSLAFLPYCFLGLFAMAEGPIAILMGGAATSTGLLLPLPTYLSEGILTGSGAARPRPASRPHGHGCPGAVIAGCHVDTIVAGDDVDSSGVECDDGTLNAFVRLGVEKTLLSGNPDMLESSVWQIRHFPKRLPPTWKTPPST